MGNLCRVREHSVQFFVQFLFNAVKLHSLTQSVWGPLEEFPDESNSSPIPQSGYALYKMK